ncbi:Trypsin-1, partial [Caligus rogercresseyi]
MDKDTVITAAQCCANFNPNYVQVVAGEHDFYVKSGDEQAVNVDKIIYHELYGSSGTNYDVCLLKLKSSLELNDKVKAVSLPKKDEEFNEDVVVSGWGTLRDGGHYSNELRAVSLLLVPDVYCEYYYPGMIDETMICASSFVGAPAMETPVAHFSKETHSSESSPGYVAVPLLDTLVSTEKSPSSLTGSPS